MTHHLMHDFEALMARSTPADYLRERYTHLVVKTIGVFLASFIFTTLMCTVE